MADNPYLGDALRLEMLVLVVCPLLASELPGTIGEDV